ncbi:hypothetical protein CWI37_0382p0030 [Hamiltosporidium tvaerminnensis]|uniref:Uncharacterized protein n=1 Tax=Hamiltosporidium tvaerminnensis TaxID=1176355 RepID=A0A4Q9L5U1_9MICR|nr:hypothetical protein LUQ84_003277 [Hamiltosporidium tvaerminnensis]TBU02968.1 hypothetical protein CWI37_0382p0030 [Hamiltosporidium tvaerminnensis]
MSKRIKAIENSLTDSENTKNIIKKQENAEIEIEYLKKENIKLRGEISIVRQNMVYIERENYSMKEQQRQKLKENLDKADVLKKEVKMLQMANKIKENQLRAFKVPSAGIQELPTEIDNKWILEQLYPKIFNSEPKEFCEKYSEINFSSISGDFADCDYNHLKFLQDFLPKELNNIISHPNLFVFLENMKDDFEKFLSHFLIFSIKKDVFDKYFPFILEKKIYNNSDHTDKIFKIVNYSPFEWIMELLNTDNFIGLLSHFLKINISNDYTLLFYIKIATERSFILNLFLTKDMFDILVKNTNNYYIKKLIQIICTNKLISYVDSNNINYIGIENLKNMFGDEFFEFEF